MGIRGINFSLRLMIGLAGASALVSASAARAPVAANADLSYVQDPAAAADRGQRIVDTRPEARCRAGSVAGAVCLPPEAFFGPHRRLASFRDISWVLGTAGLQGDEQVLVLGNDPVRRDAVAALLYLAGQSRVVVLNGPIDALLDAGAAEQSAGQPRGILRDPIHTGPWREDRILLRNELAEALADGGIGQLLDGRTADEYWGERIRARRGGHVPGAELAPAAQLRTALARHEPAPDSEGPIVAYTHDPLTGLAYLTLLRAGFGLDAALYLGGWREWADDGRLPADALSYSEPAQASEMPSAPMAAWSRSLVTLAAVLSAGGFGYLLGRRTN